MSTYANEVLSGALAELRGRRAKLEQFIAEARDLDKAIRETEKLCKKLGVAEPTGPRRVIEREPTPHREPKAGTNADRALKLLRDHPRGLNTSVIAQRAEIAQGSVSVVLSDLEKAGQIVKVGRGFWRIADVSAAA